MLKICVISLLFGFISLCVSFPIVTGPRGWKTVPYTAIYRDNMDDLDDAPGPSHGYGHDRSQQYGHHGSHGMVNSMYGHRPSNYGMRHGQGHGHAHAHANMHQGHVKSPFLPLPTPEKTSYIQKLIPLMNFGGALRRLFHYNDEYSDGYSHRTGEAWPWHGPRGPIWNANGNPRPVEIRSHGWKRAL